LAARRKAISDEAALVCGGRQFQARAAATGNARSPRVEIAASTHLPTPEWFSVTWPVDQLRRPITFASGIATVHRGHA